MLRLRTRETLLDAIRVLIGLNSDINLQDIGRGLANLGSVPSLTVRRLILVRLRSQPIRDAELQRRWIPSQQLYPRANNRRRFVKPLLSQICSN